MHKYVLRVPLITWGLLVLRVTELKKTRLISYNQWISDAIREKLEREK